MRFLKSFLNLFLQERHPLNGNRGGFDHHLASGTAKQGSTGAGVLPVSADNKTKRNVSVAEKVSGSKLVVTKSTEAGSEAKHKLETNKRPSASRGGPPSGRLTPKDKPNRDAYYVQVGLDFGTCYCKVVCREIFRDRAWVHLSNNPADPERPFLLPSALQLRSGSLSLAPASAHYHEGGLPHVKVALAMVATGEFNHDSVAPYREGAGTADQEVLKKFVFDCGVYLLGGIIAEVKEDVRERYPDFGTVNEDSIAISLAVPVADAEKPEITQLYREVLQTAFFCAESLAGHPAITRSSLSKLAQSVSIATDQEEFRFFVYPEVSAGVQGFVRSRVSNDGIYLFSETGAATVDQSVFILFRPKDENARLTYLNARVLPLGSSRIEWHAARSNGNLGLSGLEHWRKLKESNDKCYELRKARYEVGEQLRNASWHTLGVARRKLPCKRQFGELRLLFGGGGHVRVPYEESVLEVFDDETLHGKTFEPEVVTLPVPRDLEPSQEIRRWMNRLWIAYGLSFFPGDYPNHSYPKDQPDALQVITPDIPVPRKEDC